MVVRQGSTFSSCSSFTSVVSERECDLVRPAIELDGLEESEMLEDVVHDVGCKNTVLEELEELEEFAEDVLEVELG